MWQAPSEFYYDQERYPSYLPTNIKKKIDPGEASAIALALELNKPLIIMDDLKGRKLAEELGLNITDTLGVLIDGRKKGYIKSLKTVLQELSKTNFRLTDELIAKALQLVGE